MRRLKWYEFIFKALYSPPDSGLRKIWSDRLRLCYSGLWWPRKLPLVISDPSQTSACHATEHAKQSMKPFICLMSSHGCELSRLGARGFCCVVFPTWYQRLSTTLKHCFAGSVLCGSLLKRTLAALQHSEAHSADQWKICESFCFYGGSSSDTVPRSKLCRLCGIKEAFRCKVTIGQSSLCAGEFD